ncbi:hypothetical protein CICLE_v10023017mg [Citrus x clementina]|uniref:Uncharacterized protein n=1 Tax=Citrus clementina TaxID=85681 RepID=V4VRL7_CITCL|nr:hypothetical protein CICLE_v10023017mg [Citrus x clementina]
MFLIECLCINKVTNLQGRILQNTFKLFRNLLELSPSPFSLQTLLQSNAIQIHFHKYFAGCTAIAAAKQNPFFIKVSLAQMLCHGALLNSPTSNNRDCGRIQN